VRKRDNITSTRQGWTSSSAALILIALLLLGPACADDTSPSDGGTTTHNPADTCAVTLTALCERQVGCNVGLLNQATTIDACVDDARRTCEPTLQTWLTSLDAGRASFSADALADCDAALAEASCRALAGGALPPTCQSIFVGDHAQDDPCYTDIECAAPLTCANAGACPGTCQPPTTDDAPIAFDCRLAGCPDDHYCSGRTCKPRLPEGDRCTAPDTCAPGLFCGKDANAPDLLCRPRKPEGQLCFSRAYCQDGLTCQLAGDGTSTCQPALAEGQPCRDTEACPPGLICEPGGAACVPPLAEEQVCLTNSDCATGLYCWLDYPDDSPRDGLCREEGKVGIAKDEVCNPALDRCRLGLYCRTSDLSTEFGTCTLLPELHQTCADFGHNLNAQCRDGVCIERDGQFTCVDLKEPGEGCQRREECISGACAAGLCAAFEDTLCTLDTP